MKKIHITNRLQKNYTYTLSAPIGKQFHPDFRPQLSPKQMIDLGIFGGCYDTVNSDEFPQDWFTKNHLQHEEKSSDRNFFKVSASQPMKVWIDKGWIFQEDPQGWFQWYCRYYMGRRLFGEDERQIKRWKAMTRHVAQIKKNCSVGDMSCRPKQRQALLHWAYDSVKM
jgi:hypothetical protein